MVDSVSARQVGRDDEIDLVELAAGLWQQKFLIILVTVLVALAAAGYAYFSKPVYEAKVHLLPPSLSDIAGLTPFTVGDVYGVFIRNLNAEETRRNFFRSVYLPSLNQEQQGGSRDALYTHFNKALNVPAADKNHPERFSVVSQAGDPVLAADRAREYIELAGKKSLDEVMENTRREMDVKARSIQRRIDVLRASAAARRADRKSQLAEALVVAESVGLQDPPMISGAAEKDTQLNAFMDGALMYMRGSKALQAELEVLSKRTSDDPFIPELRNLEERLALFHEAQPDLSSVAVFKRDGEVEVPDTPIKPKKLMILALGIVLGGMLGVFIALVRLFVIKRPQANGSRI